MELTSEERASLNGERGEILQTAYRILVATGEATNAEKLIPIDMGTSFRCQLQYNW